jgi:hypothetical protein
LERNQQDAPFYDNQIGYLIMANLVLNRIKTPDGTILTSYHQRDFVSYQDKNGLDYFIDGGTYCRRASRNDEDPHEDLCVYDDEDFEIVRRSYHWGTRGINGDQPVKWVPLSQLDTDHIEAILETETYLKEYRRELFLKELKYRKRVLWFDI